MHDSKKNLIYYKYNTRALSQKGEHFKQEGTNKKQEASKKERREGLTTTATPMALATMSSPSDFSDGASDTPLAASASASSTAPSKTSGLRHRKNNTVEKPKPIAAVHARHESITLIPVDTSDGTTSTTLAAASRGSIAEVTQIPTAQTTKEKSDDDHNDDHNDNDGTPSHGNGNENRNGPRLAMTGAEVKKDENRFQKIVIRAISGFSLIGIFMVCIYLGHVYVCGLVALSEFLLFRELVKVRYNAYFHTRIENTIPLFRTTQWMWFCVAIFYTYGDFISEVIQSNTSLHYLVAYAQYLNSVAFLLYSCTFVVTIATMQVGHIKFQLNQLCWTIVVLCLTVGQMKYIMHNIFNGLFWFAFPFMLVVMNDVMAYFCGISCGRKFIHKPFVSVSPNKTWEGFIGGGIFTMIFAWYFSKYLANYTWMTCPVNDFDLFPSTLHCDDDGSIHHIFVEAQSIFPDQIFELFPHSLVKMIPGIVEICSSSAGDDISDSVDNDFVGIDNNSAIISNGLELTRCISGESTQTFHHFELIVRNVIPIQIHALWLGFFASVVGPFGGFLASAIKRAYGIKDFDSIIPGHGGVTDRLDCQFLMALCTWVHYNSFCRMTTISVPKLVYHYNMMSVTEKKQFLEAIVPTASFDNSSENYDGGPLSSTNELLLKQFQDYALS